MEYELHPLCTLFPRIIDDEFVALTADIKTHGLREPIILHDGMILDGGNRYRACKAAGVAPNFLTFGGGNLVTFVLSANLHRRHLTPGQQAAIVASAQNWATVQSGGRPKPGNVTGLNTVAERQAQSGASEKTQRNADKVAKADPGLAVQVARGEVSLTAAVRKVSNPTPKPTKPKPDPVAPYVEKIDNLKMENEQLRDAMEELRNENLATLDATAAKNSEGGHDLLEQVTLLRAEIVTLERNLETVTISRNTFMQENATLKNIIKTRDAKIKKLEGEKNATAPKTI